MKTSPSGLKFIDDHEGEVLKTYLDAAGEPTIGIGHLLRPGEAYPAGITHDQAIQMLAVDVMVAEHVVNRSVPEGTLSQNAFDACVDFAFNCGTGAFLHSTVLKCIRAGDMEGAAAAFLLWDKRLDPVSKHLVDDPGLLARRKDEAALFLTPDVPMPVM